MKDQRDPEVLGQMIKELVAEGMSVAEAATTLDDLYFAGKNGKLANPVFVAPK